MLVPAILYKEEIEKAFAKELYTDNYFYYQGYGSANGLPKISAEDCLYQYAVVNTHKKLIGYLGYQIDTNADSVYNFGLYSFDKGNPIIGKDLYEKLEELVEIHHRIEWRMVSGNPVKKHYDKFLNKYNGNVVVLHDVCKDSKGNYHDSYIYEIIKNKGNKGMSLYERTKCDETELITSKRKYTRDEVAEAIDNLKDWSNNNPFFEAVDRVLYMFKNVI